MGADLMIQGMQRAGKNATSAGIIRALRRLTSYNGGGLLPTSINYSTVFGHDLPQQCGWYLQAKKSGFALVSKKPFCGTDLPGTSTATAS